MVYKHFSVGVCTLPSMTLKKHKSSTDLSSKLQYSSDFYNQICRLNIP